MFEPFKTDGPVVAALRAGAWLIVGLVLGSVAVVITHVVVSAL